jgi:hypothetical protein
MAASDEFPRGRVLTAGNTGSPIANPTVTLPAQPGIAHIIDEITISGYIFNGGIASPASTQEVQIVSAGLNIVPAILTGTDVVAANGLTPFSGSLVGPITAQYGDQVIINWVFLNNGGGFMAVRFHDI